MTQPRKTAPKKAAPKPVEPARKSAAQIEAEATGDEFVSAVVKYGDFEVEIPIDQDYWPTETCRLFARGNWLLATDALLGPENTAEFGRKFPMRRDYRMFVDELVDTLGFGDAKN